VRRQVGDDSAEGFHGVRRECHSFAIDVVDPDSAVLGLKIGICDVGKNFFVDAEYDNVWTSRVPEPTDRSFRRHIDSNR